MHFFQKRFKLYIVLAYNFLKPYISKICNGLSLYIYIYDLIRLNLDSSVYSPNYSLTTKILKINGHVVKNWTPIEIQFRIHLDCSIFTLNNLLGTKFKINWDTWRKIENPIKI